LHNLGKGDVWVNGHCLGRFWNIGPTQTACAPGCWLHAGTNEIVIFDVLGSESHSVAGLEKPVLDELHPEKDFLKSHRPLVKLNFDSVMPVQTAAFAPGGDTQDIKFSAPATGKYFCLESLDAFDGKPYAAIAELDLLDENGNAISHNGWTIAYVDSEERNAEDGAAENAIDGQTANYWHTEWKNARPDHPHYLILNLGKSRTISGFRYVPRQGADSGRIKDYRVLIGDGLVH
jgi:beta-galactosidase